MCAKKVTFGKHEFRTADSDLYYVAIKAKIAMINVPKKSSIRAHIVDKKNGLERDIVVLSESHFRYIYLLNKKRLALGSISEKWKGLKRHHTDCNSDTIKEVIKIRKLIIRINVALVELEFEHDHLRYEDPGLWNGNH